MMDMHTCRDGFFGLHHVLVGAFEEALKGAYAEGDEYKETITWAKVRQLLKVPSNWLIFIQVRTPLFSNSG